jgi:dihydrofolate synthase/folylpolyglutamate synthase
VLVRPEADGSWFEAKGKDGREQSLFCQLGAGYQAKNIAAVLTSIDLLQDRFPVAETAVQKGLAEVKTLTGLRGRWDCLRRVPLTFADVAHNVPGMEELIKQIALTPHQRLHLVIGFVKDKQIDELLRLLPTDAHYYFTQASIERALPATDLAEKARQFQLIGKAFTDVNLALEAAWAAASNDDLVVVCGSIFLVGELDALRI